MKEEVNEFVIFQGEKVTKEYRDVYMEGYDNPWGKNTSEKYKSAFKKGQLDSRRDTSMEGTF